MSKIHIIIKLIFITNPNNQPKQQKLQKLFSRAFQLILIQLGIHSQQISFRLLFAKQKWLHLWKIKACKLKKSFKDRTEKKIHKKRTPFQLSGRLEETCAFAELCYLCLVECRNIKWHVILDSAEFKFFLQGIYSEIKYFPMKTLWKVTLLSAKPSWRQLPV